MSKLFMQFVHSSYVLCPTPSSILPTSPTHPSHLPVSSTPPPTQPSRPLFPPPPSPPPLIINCIRHGVKIVLLPLFPRDGQKFGLWSILRIYFYFSMYLSNSCFIKLCFSFLFLLISLTEFSFRHFAYSLHYLFFVCFLTIFFLRKYYISLSSLKILSYFVQLVQ